MSLQHFKAACIAIAISLLACGEGDRFEDVDKLRAIGVASNPVAAAATPAGTDNSVLLTFHALVPLGQEVTHENFTDTEAPYGLAVPIAFIADSATYTDYAQFRHFTVQAAMPLPSREFIPGDVPFVRVRYGAFLRSGEEEEQIVGNVLLFPEATDETKWQQHSVSIDKPIASAEISGETDISATLAKAQEEPIRIAWYVSSGKLRARRAIETVWDPEEAGTQTLVLTARGRRSNAFSVEIRDVVVK